MKRRMTNPGRKTSHAPFDADADPVAAFWFHMANQARTDCLRNLHQHLALQRTNFLEYRREQLALQQHA